MKLPLLPGLLLVAAGAAFAAPLTPNNGGTGGVIHVDAGRVVNRVTPWMTGSCIEDVNHEIYGGLYDQKIFGESFEEPPASGSKLPDDSHATASPSVSGMWDAVDTGSAQASFLHDPVDPFNGRYSQKIVHGAGSGCVGIANRGLNRWGIAVKKGQIFAGRLYLRGFDLQGPVTVALQSVDGAQTYARATITHVIGAWAKYPFTLKSTATATDPDARFAVWIDKPGTLWVDQAVLMGTGEERFHGLPIRADIAQAIVDEGVSFLRYGGSMVNAPGYRWKNMIGDPDRRPPYDGHWYPYSTNGFGIFDFLNFCEAAHIDAAFAINIEESAQDAADLADYLTAPTSNPWGRRRAADGHPKPYRVHYIEIGNEECLGGDDPAAYLHYASRFLTLARAIHSRNPSLKLVSAAWWRPDSPSVEAVFKAIGGQAAAWDLHVGGDDPRTGDEVDRDLTTMEQRFHHWDPATSMKAVIFEENGGRHDLQRALGHATALQASMRHGDFVLVDCPANCLQPMGQNDNGWDQGQIFFDPSRVWPMPPYHAQQMASTNYEPLRVQSNVDGSPDLYAIATRGVDGRTLVVSVVNVGSTAQATSIRISGFAGIRPKVETLTLFGSSGPPKRAVIGVDETSFTYRFPAKSYVVLRLRR